MREIVNSDAGGERGARFCAKVPSSDRHRCYAGVGSVIAAIEPTPKALRAECKRLSGRQSRACLEGAGVLAPKA